MTVPAVTVLSYLWHYLVARVVYDRLIRPILHGDAAHLAMLASVVAIAFALGRWVRRRA